MSLIPEQVIDDVQARADIAEVIGRYVPLKRAGRHFKALCPFHRERTPSFMVNTEKQIFHCFGCGVGGNIFSFLMEHDRLTFPEAVRHVAEQVGVAVPETQATAGHESARGLTALLEKVCAHLERRLAHPQQGRAAREYLAERGVSEATAKRFRLGLAPEGWRHLLTAAQGRGVSDAQLEAAGLVIRGAAGAYDRFRNRLIFPILDARGRVVGFGGRSLDGTEPKYLNSPETAVYTKGRHLYGLAQAKDAILGAKRAVVVEGYFDCVVLSGAGVLPVVSPLGTALTTEQARLLKRYAEEVVLAFDADAAGEAATLRGMDVAVEAGLAVRVARLPAGVDPDEYVRAHGRKGFEALVERSDTVFDFLVETALRRSPPRSLEGKVRAAQFVLPTLAKVPNAMLRREYVRRLAERLGLDESAVAEELRKAAPRGTGREAPQPSAAASTPAPGPERMLTALVLDDPSRWEAVSARVRLDDIGDPALRRVLSMVCELETRRHRATPAQVVSRLTEDGHGTLITALVDLAQTVEDADAVLADCIGRVRRAARAQRVAGLQRQLKDAQEAGRDAEVQRLLRSVQQAIKEA